MNAPDLAALDRPLARSDEWHAEYRRALETWLAGEDLHDLAVFDDEAMTTFLQLMAGAVQMEITPAERGKRMQNAFIAFVHGCAIEQANICQRNGWPE